MRNSIVMFIFVLSLTINIFFWKICSKKSKLFVEADIRNLELLKYLEFVSDVHFFYRLEILFFGLTWS